MKPIFYRDHMIIPADNRVAVMVPHVKSFVDPDSGRAMMLVPHQVDETTVLRNLGYEVKPPVLMNYTWRNSTPFDAQRITTALITTHKRSYVLNGLGTGKTRSALFAYDYLSRVQRMPGALLVVAPLSTLRQVWQKECMMVFPDFKVGILHGSKAKRLQTLGQDCDVFVINHDGVLTILDELIKQSYRFGMCVLDELSVYKNANTDLWKGTNKLVQRIDRVTGLTATPMPTAATDAYGQIKMIAPAPLQGRSFGRFREDVMKKVTQFKWINRDDSVDRVYKMMQPSVRFTRDECYDLPPVQYVDREAPLPEATRKMILQIQDQGAIEAMSIKAVNGADVINKCLQAALGVVYDTDHNEVHTDVADRLDLLDEAIEQSDSKVIVFTPYKSTLRLLAGHVAAKHTIAVVSGDVGQNQRERIFTEFMHNPDPHVLIAHPECMSHGLTLTEASTIVWWGPPQSLETYEQANGRITRAGQRHSQLIIQLTSTKLERKIFKLLQARANVQQALLDLFESQDLKDLSQ